MIGERYSILEAYIHGFEIELQQSLLDRYLIAVLRDFEQFRNFAERELAFADDSISPSSELQFRLNNSLKFDAFCQFAKAEKIDFNISVGAILSIDDLMSRLMSNSDIFSHDLLDKSIKYVNGYNCLWLKRHGQIHPKIRFYDYNLHSIFPTSRLHNKIVDFSSFFSVFPLDEERAALFKLMSLIGISWIYLHEETHYWRGHCHYLSQTDIKSNLLSEINNRQIGESHNLYKALEWEADRGATNGIIDVFFSEQYLRLLPNSYQEKGYLWLLRLILLSIGAVQLNLFKIQEIKGSTDFYPSATSRFIAVLYQGLGRVFNKQSYFDRLDKDSHYALSWLVFNSIYDLSGAAELYFDLNEDINYSGRYDSKLDFKNLSIFENEDDYLKLSSQFLKLFLINRDKWGSELDSCIYHKYFNDFFETMKFQEYYLHPNLVRFRKMTTKSGESVDPTD